MVGTGTTEIFITFLLSITGYVGLTTVVVLTLRGQHPIALWRAIALIILAHVLMVWIYRYDWQFDLAVRNGYAGFVHFPHRTRIDSALYLYQQKPISKTHSHIICRSDNGCDRCIASI